MGKGSVRRPGDEEAYRRNWEIIFSKCPECGNKNWDYESGYCDNCSKQRQPNNLATRRKDTRQTPT